ncbi:MAG: S8 family serine peptidase [Myxococcota bacterium]
MGPPDTAPDPQDEPAAVTVASFALPPVADEATSVAPSVELASDFVAGQRMLRLSDPDQIDALAETYGLTILRRPGRSGYALLEGPTDGLVAASQDPRVQASLANGVIWGVQDGATSAGQSGGASQTYDHLQWHHDRMKLPANPAVGDRVVAVLDTGVAYETAVRDGVAYTQAPSLASSAIVAPYDFVNDDPHANDDHQHGTHIASIIASSGVVRGVAAGVALMPIKVLDADNQGHELGLIEAIWHAIDHGADVINMSLSFGEQYRPSLALQEALAAAADAGIVMIGASGNRGTDMVSWPAASPHVMAIGAAELGDDDTIYLDQGRAGYGNASASIALLAPGGNIDKDVDENGLADGILAESISPDDPSQVGLWLMAGTSQSAAMLSGLAAALLENGIAPADISATLQYQGKGGSLEKGEGSGMIDLWNLLPGPGAVQGGETFYVAMLPFLEHDFGEPDEVRPAARVVAFEADGRVAKGVHVFGTIAGNGDGRSVLDRRRWRLRAAR